MNLEVQKIRLSELENFVKSKAFNQFDTVPITPGRAKSYIQNPNAKPGDIVLYMGFMAKKLVAFRTIFAGVANSKNGKIHFGWCSGNWVHPNFRRKGFSEQLLREAYSDWGKKLMFTNYAPNSERLYLKTGWFRPIHRFNGVRGYLFPKTRKLIARASANFITKTIFSSIDFLISVYAILRIFFYREKNVGNASFEVIDMPDKNCYSFKNEDQKTTLFERGEPEFNWIFKFPWISGSTKSFVSKYPFSSYSTSFRYKTVKVFREDKFAGFFLFSVREGHLKTLHFAVQPGVEKEIPVFLKAYCIDHKIELLTLYNSSVAGQFIAQKSPFLHLKEYGQKIYSSFEIDGTGYTIQDGDGDTIFT